MLWQNRRYYGKDENFYIYSYKHFNLLKDEQKVDDESNKNMLFDIAVAYTGKP
jgi:hypothetical protein